MSKIDTIDHITSKNLEKYRNSIPRKAFVAAMDLVKDATVEAAQVPDGEPVPGIQIIKSPYATAGELADLLSGACPPFTSGCWPVPCSGTPCRECWLAWLATGRPPEQRKEE